MAQVTSLRDLHNRSIAGWRVIKMIATKCRSGTSGEMVTLALSQNRADAETVAFNSGVSCDIVEVFAMTDGKVAFEFAAADGISIADKVSSAASSAAVPVLKGEHHSRGRRPHGLKLTPGE